MKTQSFGFLFFGFILSSNTSFYFEWLKRKSTFEKNGIFEKKNLLLICDVPNMPNYFWQKIFFPDEAYLRYIKLEKIGNHLIFGILWTHDHTGQQPKLYWHETSCFHMILGRWIRIRHPFFPITSKFCSIANFMVARSENQFFAFCEKTLTDIENLITYRRFRIKFCAFTKKKEIKNRFIRARDIVD